MARRVRRKLPSGFGGARLVPGRRTERETDMIGFTLRIGPAVRLFASLLIGGVAPVAALAQVSTTSAVPMTYFVVQQPVDLCTDSPRAGATTDCAYINNSF